MEQTDKKISQMPPLQTVSGEEIVPVVKSGGNYSALVNQIVALARQTMVAAETGKGLSANDFTDAFKAKLEGLSNYDDAEVRSLITAVNGRLDTILGDGASTAIDTFNEIEAFLTGITDTQTLTGLLAEQKQTITSETDNKLAGKVDKVSGKGLSANDYTNADKTKLGALPTKTELDASLASKQPAITPSDDIAPLGADKLALTDKAKMAELDAQAAAIGAIHNYTTGYFEYNTLTDITVEQMRAIIPFITLGRLGGNLDFRFLHPIVRTLTVYVEYFANYPSMEMAFAYGNDVLEVIKFVTPNNNTIMPSNVKDTFRYCVSLRLIDGTIDLSGIKGDIRPCHGCSALEEIRIKSLKSNIFFADSPLLSLTSIQYMVDNAANTTPITITLHPDAYARVTEELIAQAAEKQITFATT